jgi:hypothetical protein
VIAARVIPFATGLALFLMKKAVDSTDDPLISRTKSQHDENI